MGLDRNVLFALATSGRWERGVRTIPAVERLAWRAASRYVAGVDAASAVDVARQVEGLGAAVSIDYFGELVEDLATADRVAEEYARLIDGLDETKDAWPAIDLSHLGLDIDPYGCVERLAAIAERVPDGRRVQVGAEDASRSEAVIGCVLSVAGSGLADRLGATVQANLRRSPADLERLVAAGVHIRLVKGAYVEPADRAVPYGEPTDVAYLRLAHRLAEAEAPFSLATHDGVLREALLAALGARQVEQLYGVRPEVVADLVARGIPVRVYVPYGDSWFRYWMRRVAESRGV